MTNYTAPYVCPACGRRFRDSHGRGGHYATRNDALHQAHRARHIFEPRGEPPDPPATEPESPDGPRDAMSATSERYGFGSLLRDLTAIAPRPEPDAPGPPEAATPATPGTAGRVLTVFGILWGAYGLYLLARSLKGANAPLRSATPPLPDLSWSALRPMGARRRWPL